MEGGEQVRKLAAKALLEHPGLVLRLRVGGFHRQDDGQLPLGISLRGQAAQGAFENGQRLAVVRDDDDVMQFARKLFHRVPGWHAGRHAVHFCPPPANSSAQAQPGNKCTLSITRNST